MIKSKIKDGEGEAVIFGLDPENIKRLPDEPIAIFGKDLEIIYDIALVSVGADIDPVAKEDYGKDIRDYMDIIRPGETLNDLLIFDLRGHIDEVKEKGMEMSMLGSDGKRLRIYIVYGESREQIFYHYGFSEALGMAYPGEGAVIEKGAKNNG